LFFDKIGCAFPAVPNPDLRRALRLKSIKDPALLEELQRLPRLKAGLGRRG